MSNLSHQAQAILNAYRDAPVEDEPTAAAVLRTAALYCKKDKLILLTLAEELEDTKYGTYRCDLLSDNG